ncbi:pyruvate dehydrogenase (acetyl-transferring) E1 component subunit alpha [Aliifodinibius sp. S!AR15-10]|uniref:pyruvate dehydrogenase (acetyl-transferring) E1 component subunit alpha n=1 Tax=Aliifodinibius sp. S!AR15-10 TaxID=2950437 RepID=UPI00285E61C5|nr:pyruvate dehydrogenase (acetyl-transferring) E1 component subunit alpha [Aliifodinibius sp. S!AR15-10]MDR8390864.1 pyruvate dehydrogenase (acetyl-transferring) E1 component subunit alpha [Aliifodinibius sp. S!AR15-10]
MAKQKNKEITFTPSGTGIRTNGQIVRSTELPSPTRKKHKSLGLSEQDVVDMFEQMYLQRRFEERAMQMYQKGKFGGFLHLYMGQEAVSTGTVYALNDDDDIITAYRDHGWGLCRGVSPKEGMAELYGKVTGCSKGKGGSMHFANVENNFWGGYGIVGGHIPIGGGIAFANKYRDTGRVTACFLGDGAVDQGVLHETLNMSKLWGLPCIYAVENNGYAMGTAVHRHTVGEIHERAKAYDMKSAVINGMDVFTVYENMKEIAKSSRENSEPWFVEIRTYRYRGHSMSDPMKYRTKEELKEYEELDPIERIKSYILDNDLADQEKLDEIQEDIEQRVLDAIDFAEESDFPEEEHLYKDVFVEDDYPFHT